jgi:hypothetical protein
MNHFHFLRFFGSPGNADDYSKDEKDLSAGGVQPSAFETFE